MADVAQAPVIVDGITIESCLLWRPGPAQGRDVPVWDGDQHLCAVAVFKDGHRPELGLYYDYAIVSFECDEGGHYRELIDGEDTWGWGWHDVEWYVPMTEIAAPSHTLLQE